MILSRSEPPPIPRDDEAERCVVDCLMHGATDDELDPARHVVHAGRHSIVLTLDALRWCGTWTTPATSAPCDVEPAARANGLAAAAAVESVGIWHVAGTDPRHEVLAECYGMAGGHPEHLPHYVARLEVSHQRRRLAEIGERLILAASNPATDIAELAEVLA